MWGPWGEVPASAFGMEPRHVEWHPVPAPQCRLSGARLHALAMVVALIVLLPLGQAALVHSKGPHRAMQAWAWMKKFKPLGLALAWVSCVSIFIHQRSIMHRADCVGSGTAMWSPHASYVLVVLSGFTAEAVVTACLPRLSAPQAVRRACRAFFDFFAGTSVAYDSWVLTLHCALTLIGALTGVWLSLGCYEYSSTQDQEIGHLCYVLMWIGVANLSLAYNHPTQRLKLQRIEGRLMVLLGSTAITILTLAKHGGAFWGYHVGAEKMKNVQHTVTAGIWVLGGVLFLGLTRLKIVSGAPYLLCAVFHGSMILVHGHQANPLSLTMHNFHGYGMFLAGALRYSERLPEYAIFTTLMASMFSGSSKCLAAYAWQSDINVVGWAGIVTITVSGLWIWYFAVIFAHPSRGIGGVHGSGTTFYVAENMREGLPLAGKYRTPSSSESEKGAYHEVPVGEGKTV